jgi:thymidylate synthase
MIFVSVDTESREISMNHIQRSGDVPVGVAGNLVQYSALLLMLAQVTGYRAKELVYYISDAHIYERQIPDVERLVATEPQKFPKLILDPNVENIFAFRREHFHVEEYEPRLERMNIWTPV